MSDARFSRSRRRQIVADWALEFPQFGVLNDGGAPLLVRLVGPLVQGICLEPYSDMEEYRVLSFVHFLGREAPGITLGLRTAAAKPNGATRALKVRSHPAGIAETAEVLRGQTSLSLDALPTFADVVDAYGQEIETISAPGYGFQAFFPLEQLILLSAMFGRLDIVAATVAQARDISASWPIDRLPHGNEWLTELERHASSPEVLWATVPKEITKHRLDAMPTNQLMP